MGLLGRKIGSSQQNAETPGHAFMPRAVFEPTIPAPRVAQDVLVIIYTFYLILSGMD
jgi:hypothetical protein